MGLTCEVTEVQSSYMREILGYQYRNCAVGNQFVMFLPLFYLRAKLGSSENSQSSEEIIEMWRNAIQLRVRKNHHIRENRKIGISIVIPMYNEAECIENTVAEITSHLRNLPETFEIILVNDGSTDGSQVIAKNLANSDERIRLISFTRNMGHMKALEAGLLASYGELIVSIDADLQDDPSYITEMYRIIKQTDEYGSKLFDVVQSVRSDRSTDTFWKKISATMYYKIMHLLTGTEVIPQAADFRMLTRKTLDLVNQIPETGKVYRLLLPSLGFRIATLETRREERFAGKTKYTFKKMTELAADSLISFSKRPLRLIIKIGVIFLLSMLTYLLFSLYQWSNGATIQGWTSLLIVVLLSNSLVLISLGVIGEYIGRVFEQSKGRPSIVWTEYNSEPKNYN
jgi:dolichol-phosphate mannosyltransferase